MRRMIILTVLAMVMVLVTSYNSFAANPITINITAAIPPMTNGLEATITTITSGTPNLNDCNNTGDNWGAHPTTMPFGMLVWHPETPPCQTPPCLPMKIFLPTVYFAVDVGVLDNVHPNWQISHATSSFVRTGGTQTLNSNVNVTFMKQTIAIPAGTPIGVKESYGSSNGRIITSTHVDAANGGWLRIYYGFATGKKVGAASCDAVNTKPVTMGNLAGSYSGQVTLTFAAL